MLKTLRTEFQARFMAVLLSGLAVLSLSACTPHGTYNDTTGRPQLVAAPDKVTLLLAQAADKASNALETLAAIEQARTPAASIAPIDQVPDSLARAMTISWVGPVEPITRTLANHSDYQLIVLGDEPPVPIVVNLDAENRRVIDLLRDIGLQLGSRADIHVDAAGKVVELQYAPVINGIGGG